MLDGQIKLILDSFLIATELPSEIIAKLRSAYRQPLVNDLIHLLDGKLVYYERTITSSKLIYCIVVPTNLRHDIFLTFHTSPTVGRM